MRLLRKAFSLWVWCSLTGILVASGEAETFRVATFNVENYVAEGTATRSPKSAEAKAKVRESIRALKPDVIALQEMGNVAALQELRQALKTEGLDLSYWEHITGHDTNVHVAVLSRYPFTARRPRTNETFLLGGRRFRVSRGFAEVDIQVNPNYAFTLLAAHLKSKRVVAEADEAELRFEEAKLLRERIDAALNANAQTNLVVLGDFNDNKDSASVKVLVGRGRGKLIDSRPAERNGNSNQGVKAAWEPRQVSWTHYYEKEDAFGRLDYILLSPGLAREWIPEESYVLAEADWGLASDHRPIVATFEAADK